MRTAAAPRRLRSRLAFRAAGLAAVALAAVAAVVEGALVRPLAAEADAALRDRLDSLAAVVAEGGEEGFRRRAPAWVRPGRDEFAALRAPGGGLRAAFGRVSSSAAAEAIEGEVTEFEDPVAGRYRVVARSVSVPGGQALGVVAGASVEETRARQAALRTLALAAAGGGVLLVAVGAWFGAALVLDPLRRMTEGARDLRGAAGGRLPARDPGDEFDDLARLLNDLLARTESALEEERRFAGDAAHELRSPVAVLRLRAEHALRDGGPGESRAALEGVLADADRIQRLVQALLELSRTPRSAEGSAPPAVDAVAVLEDLGTDLRTLAEARGLAFSLAPPPEGTRTVGPREVLETAVSVLVDNAFRYTPAGGRVSVEAEAGQGRLRVRVRDTGPGVAEDEAARVFERLYRGRAGKASKAGFGLGLPLARRLARSAGGEVSLEATGPGGAVFLLDLPLAGTTLERAGS